MIKKLFKEYAVSFIKLIAFILVFALSLQFLSIRVFSKTGALSYNNYYNKAYSFLFEPENTIQIAGIGNSNLYSAFVPMTLYENTGYTSTIISSPHQSTQLSEVFLEEVLETQSPKLVIIEADMLYDGQTSYKSSEKTNSLQQKISGVTQLLSSDFLQNKVQSVFSVFLFHDRWKSFNIKSYVKNAQEEASYETIDHGYNFNNSVKPAQVNEDMKPTDLVQQIDYYEKAFFREIVSLCKSNGIEVVLVSVPTTHSWSYYKHNGAAQLAEENGVEYIDCNLLYDEIGFDITKDFRDGGSHCNYSGAVKVSNYLSNYIKEKYSDILTDTRNDAAFEYWRESNEAFKKEYLSK